MSLSGDERAFAVYRSLAGTQALTGEVDGSGKPLATQVRQPDGSMGPSEKYRMLQQLQALWGADTAYLTGNAEVAPGSLAAAQGVPVSVTGSPAAQSGFTTASGPLTPTGRGRLT